MSLQNISSRTPRRLPADMQRFFIQERQRELIRQAKAEAAKKKAADEAKKAETAKREKADAEAKKWRDAILNDKNYLTLKQILEAQGFGDRIKGSVAQNELGENIVQESPELIKLAGMLRGINNLSPENLYSNTARIALQNMPDAYGTERWSREVTPFVANRVKLDKDGNPVRYEDGKDVLEPANPEADDILARFQQSPELQVKYLVNKSRGMTHEDAFRALGMTKPDAEITLPARAKPAPSAPAMDPVLARIAAERKKYTFPDAESKQYDKDSEDFYNPRILKLMSERRKTNPERFQGTRTPATHSPYVIRADAMAKSLVSPEMQKQIRARQEQERRDRDFKAHMEDPAVFDKIRAQTEAARAERLKLGHSRYLIAKDLAENGQWKGDLPTHEDFLAAAMNQGRDIPITSGPYQLTPSAAKLNELYKHTLNSDGSFFYNSPEFHQSDPSNLSHPSDPSLKKMLKGAR